MEPVTTLTNMLFLSPEALTGFQSNLINCAQAKAYVTFYWVYEESRCWRTYQISVCTLVLSNVLYSYRTA